MILVFDRVRVSDPRNEPLPRSLSLCLLLLLLVALPTWGKTVYVGSGGQTTNCNGTSPTSRIGNVHDGIDCLAGGDTLIIGNGTYNEGGYDSCTIPSGLSSTQQTMIQAENPRMAVLRDETGGAVFKLGEGCTQTWITFKNIVLDKGATASTQHPQRSGEGVLLAEGASNITFDGGEIRNFGGTANCAPTQAFGSDNAQANPNLVIKNSYIHHIGVNDPPPQPSSCNFSYGIYLSFSGTLIENNVWENISAYAIHQYTGHGGVTGNILRGNVFRNTGTVLLADGATIQFYNNIVIRGGTQQYDAQTDSVDADSSNMTIYNNTVVNGESSCIVGGGTGIARNNLCWNNGDNGIDFAGTRDHNHCSNGGSGGCAGAFSTPGFVGGNELDPTSWKLAATSPLIDTGTATGLPTSVDFGGNARNQGSAPDKGAWEFGSQITCPASCCQGSCPVGCTPVPCPTCPPDCPTQTDPVAWWTFDEASGNAFDSTGNGHTLTLDAGVTREAWPFGGFALKCPTTAGQSARMATAFDLPQYTWSVWVKGLVNTLGPAESEVFFNGTSASSADVWGLWWGGDASVRQSASHRLLNGNWINVGIPGALSANTWYYIAATYDGSVVRTYLNGQFQTQGAAPNRYPVSGGFAVCGNGVDMAFNGSVEDLKIWNRALTEAEIQNDFVDSSR
jgi:Concanavalin A-like lectin/glucanases superfamily